MFLNNRGKKKFSPLKQIASFGPFPHVYPARLFTVLRNPFLYFPHSEICRKSVIYRNSNISRWSLPCTLHRVSGLQVINWREWEHNEAEQSTKSLSHRWLIVTENYNLQTHPVINWRLYCTLLLPIFFFGSMSTVFNKWRLISHSLFFLSF